MKTPINKRKRKIPNHLKPSEPKPQVDEVLQKPAEPSRDVFVSNGITWRRTDTGWSCYEPIQAIEGTEVSFLAHSYLYYHLDISLVTDTFYDNLCGWLYNHMQKEPEDFRRTKYYELCKDLDESGSGFYIKKEDYPKRILQVCKRLILQHKMEVPEELKDLEQPEEWDIEGW